MQLQAIDRAQRPQTVCVPVAHKSELQHTHSAQCCEGALHTADVSHSSDLQLMMSGLQLPLQRRQYLVQLKHQGWQLLAKVELGVVGDGLHEGELQELGRKLLLVGFRLP